MASDRGLRTKFRLALGQHLAAWFAATDVPIPFEGGVLEGPQERDVGCVWFDTVSPHPRDANNEQAYFGVRVFRRFRQDSGGDVPRETQEERLEWTFETLEDALQAVINRPLLQAAVPDIDLAGWQDYFLVTEIVLNHPGQYVQATIVAQARSRTRRGG